MKSLTAVIVALLFATGASASVGIYVASPSFSTLFRRGSAVTSHFSAYASQVDERDVIVDLGANESATIESVGGEGFDCVIARAMARCGRSVFPRNTQTEVYVVVRMPANLEGGAVDVQATIQSASGSTNSTGTRVFFPRTFLVTKTDWLGDGSLTDAINSANASCTDRQANLRN